MLFWNRDKHNRKHTGGRLPSCAIRMGIHVDIPAQYQQQRAIMGSYTNDAGTHGFVRAPDGSVTSFDPLPGVCLFPPFTRPITNPTSINDDGDRRL